MKTGIRTVIAVVLVALGCALLISAGDKHSTTDPLEMDTK